MIEANKESHDFNILTGIMSKGDDLDDCNFLIKLKHSEKVTVLKVDKFESGDTEAFTTGQVRLIALNDSFYF